MANVLELVKELRDRTGVGMMECKKALEESDLDIEKAIDYLRERGIAKSASKASRVAAEGKAAIVCDGNKAVIVEINSETDFSAKTDKFNDMVTLVAKSILANEPKDVEAAQDIITAEGKLSEVIASVSFATGEKMTLRRFEIVEKNDGQIFGAYVHFDGKTAALAVLDGEKADVAKSVAMQIAAMKPQYVSREAMPAEIVEHETAVQMEIAKNDPKNEGKPENIIAKMVEGRVSKSLQDISLNDQAFIVDPNTKVGDYLKQNGMAAKSFVTYVVGEGIEKKVDNWVEEVMAATKG